MSFWRAETGRSRWVLASSRFWGSPAAPDGFVSELDSLLLHGQVQKSTIIHAVPWLCLLTAVHSEL